MADIVQKDKKPDKVKAYDFKSNIYLQPEELKAIKVTTEGYAEILGISFSNYFKEEFMVRYKGVMINKFNQLIKELRPPLIMMDAKIDGLEGFAFMHVESQLMLLMVDRFLGGDAAVMQQADKDRDITFIEERLIFKIAEKLTKYFENVYGKHADIKLIPRTVEKKVENIETIAIEEMITTIQVEAGIGEVKGIITMAFPSYLLEPILKKFIRKTAPVQIKKDVSAAYARKYGRLKEIKIEATVELERIKIKLRDIIDIQPGDTITFDHHVSAPVIVKMSGKERYRGMPGVKGKHLAVKITDKQ